VGDGADRLRRRDRRVAGYVLPEGQRLAVALPLLIGAGVGVTAMFVQALVGGFDDPEMAARTFLGRRCSGSSQCSPVSSCSSPEPARRGVRRNAEAAVASAAGRAFDDRSTRFGSDPICSPPG